MKFTYFASWEVGSCNICHQTSTLFTGALATPSMDLWSHDLTGSVKANAWSCTIDALLIPWVSIIATIYFTTLALLTETPVRIIRATI